MSTTTSPTLPISPNPDAIASQLRALVISLACVAVLSTALRLWSRAKSAARYGWDDLVIVIATIFILGTLVTSLFMIDNGLGLDMAQLTYEELTAILKGVYSFALVYVFILTFTKISILLMYCRTFPVREVLLGVWVLGSLTVVWAVVSICASVFQCTPIERAWHPLLAGKCLSLRSIAMGNAIPNIVTDAMILAMPLYQILHLRLGRVQRITLIGVFLLGGFVIVASIYRFVTLLRFDFGNITQSLRSPLIWSHAEAVTAIISANLPYMRPLLASFLKTVGLKSNASKQSQSVKWSGGPPTIGSGKPSRIQDIELNERSTIKDMSDGDVIAAQRADNNFITALEGFKSDTNLVRYQQ